MADEPGFAVGGVERTGSAGEPVQVCLEAFEFGDALCDLAGAVLDELGDVGAGGFAVVAECDDLADLAEGEADGIEWIGEPRQPIVGARFRGKNRWRGFTWWREVHITVAEPGRCFAFQTVPGRGIYNDTTKWRYDFEPTPTGTRVVESYQLTAPNWLRLMDTALRRPHALARGMRTTLATLRTTRRNPPVDRCRADTCRTTTSL